MKRQGTDLLQPWAWGPVTLTHVFSESQEGLILSSKATETSGLTPTQPGMSIHLHWGLWEYPFSVYAAVRILQPKRTKNSMPKLLLLEENSCLIQCSVLAQWNCSSDEKCTDCNGIVHVSSECNPSPDPKISSWPEKKWFHGWKCLRARWEERQQFELVGGNGEAGQGLCGWWVQKPGLKGMSVGKHWGTWFLIPCLF